MVREKIKKERERQALLSWAGFSESFDFCCIVNILNLDGMRAFLHFVCASLFRVYFRSKGGECFLLKDFEDEHSQCVRLCVKEGRMTSPSELSWLV